LRTPFGEIIALQITRHAIDYGHNRYTVSVSTHRPRRRLRSTQNTKVTPAMAPTAATATPAIAPRTSAENAAPELPLPVPVLAGAVPVDVPLVVSEPAPPDEVPDTDAPPAEVPDTDALPDADEPAPVTDAPSEEAAPVACDRIEDPRVPRRDVASEKIDAACEGQMGRCERVRVYAQPS
jgi:hypothetical protein